jgi:hypothetical protein
MRIPADVLLVCRGNPGGDPFVGWETAVMDFGDRGVDDRGVRWFLSVKCWQSANGAVYAARVPRTLRTPVTRIRREFYAACIGLPLQAEDL